MTIYKSIPDKAGLSKFTDVDSSFSPESLFASHMHEKKTIFPNYFPVFLYIHIIPVNTHVFIYS